MNPVVTHSISRSFHDPTQWEQVDKGESIPCSLHFPESIQLRDGGIALCHTILKR